MDWEKNVEKSKIEFFEKPCDLSIFCKILSFLSIYSSFLIEKLFSEIFNLVID